MAETLLELTVIQTSLELRVFLPESPKYLGL